MASSTIPTKVDCIILGTGLTSSIVAAACSRIGKSVLHLDKNNYYGDEWASFTFQQLIDWIRNKLPGNSSLEAIPEELTLKSRMFCLDLCPRLLYSNGDMVELLVKSNVSRYHEFKNNIRILSIVGREIHVLPCRRSDVFTSPLLSDLVDKRRLMKFIEMCLEFDPDTSSPETSDIAKHADRPIKDFLTGRGLRQTLKEYIINSIAMVDPTDPTIDACRNIKKFMVATERFGRSPFLFPLYGCGEFPQSFCRLSAVFGGVYCLNTQIESVKMSTLSQENLDGQPLKERGNFIVKFSNCDHLVDSDSLVVDYHYAMSLNLMNVPKLDSKVSRAILITRKSVLPNEENLISFLRIPPGDLNCNLVYFLEFNASMMVCPPDINIVYLWTKSSSENPEHDLKPCVELVLGADVSEIIWKFYYQQLIGPKNSSVETDEVRGFHITSPPHEDIDYSRCIQEAEQIFHKICPNQEFLPRAPDPDEIIT